jgi:hypothetical protein
MTDSRYQLSVISEVLEEGVVLSENQAQELIEIVQTNMIMHVYPSPPGVPVKFKCKSCGESSLNSKLIHKLSCKACLLLAALGKK